MNRVDDTNVSRWLSDLVNLHLGPGQASHSFDLNSSDDALTFLRDPNQQNLFISIDNKTRDWNISKSIKLSKEDYGRNKVIALYKVKPERIQESNADIVQVTTLPSSPLDALFHTFTALSPVAEGDDQVKSSWNALNHAFRNIAPYPHAQGLGQNATFLVDDIQTINKIGNKAASGYLSEIQALIGKCASKDDNSDPLESVEHVHDLLDELWSLAALSEAQMRGILEKIDTALVRDLVSTKSPKNNDYSGANYFLKQTILALERWNELIGSLTGKIWPYRSAGKWKGPPMDNTSSSRVVSPLKELLSLRLSMEATKSLLNEEEQKDLKISDMVHSLYEISMLDETHISESKNGFERWLGGVSAILIERLERILSSCRQQPGQLIKELKNYFELLKRPQIGDRLVSYKNIIASEFNSLLKSLNDHSAGVTQDAIVTRSLTPLTANLVSVRQKVNKVELAIDTLKLLSINDLELRNNLATILEQLRTYEKTLFEEWTSETDMSLNNLPFDTASFSPSSFLNLDFGSGKLFVNYDDQLITILKESRQLLSMGFPVPTKLQKLAEKAQRYYRVGVVLKQVAHFYNTIDQQMLPSQQSMLLGRALELEKLLKQFQAETSDDETTVATRIQKIQTATDLLTIENRRLRKFHDSLIDITTKLIGTDLVKDQSRWKELMSNIRRIIQSPHESGVREDDTLPWRNHWDHQIYKALEHQYQVGLYQLNESLQEIKVDLVFKQQKLQFQPPFEEIRAKYYREMKKFINIPSAFKQLGESGVFSRMIDENSAGLFSVYSRAEQLFFNLNKVADGFKDWVVLGTVDMDEFLENCLVDISDWELNFKMLKQKGKELETLPNFVKVDCIVVSLTPVKSSVEYQLQRLFDGLVHSLRVSISSHTRNIEEFIEKGTEILIKKPQTLADIGQANHHHELLSQDKAAIKAQFDAIDPKNKLLRSVGGSAVDMSLIIAKWNKLELMLESHDLMVKEQMDILRGAIDGRLQSFLGEVSKFSAHWNQFKPNPLDVKSRDLAIKALTFVKSKVTEFEELDKTRAQLLLDAEHFGISALDFTLLDSLKGDLIKSESDWKTFESYVSELETMRSQDWVTFRSKMNDVDAFINKWTDQIRSNEVNAIGAYIVKDLDEFRSAIPCLKLLRGDTWISEHWAEFFWFIGIGKSVTLETLSFGQLLDAKTIIFEKLAEIKELNNRANGEVSLREALQELDVWGATAAFSLTGYQDAQGRSLEIMKDWKETLTQVGDSLSLVSSLKDSPFFKSFEDRIKVWEQKLSSLDHYLRDLNLIQRRWVYLEPVFNRGALPSEQSRFARIDEDFRNILASVSQDKRIVSILSIQSIGSILPTMLDQLERCQKALSEFLEAKRERFPRFYFMGDDDLLEVLGQAKNPAVIQSHLKKLFAGVHQVEFDSSYTQITGMKSLHGERIELKRSVHVTDKVEDWLQEFTLEMKHTLKQLLIECLNVSDPLRFPLQIVSLADYLHFTSNVEEAIRKNGDFSKIEADLKTQLSKYTSFNLSHIQNEQERTLLQLKIKSLILDVIHFIDVIEQLKSARPKSLSDWCWKKQLRFYMKDKECLIQMHDAEFRYTYEYQGIPPKLVHTPLTDKCYLTFTQAMANGFGGNSFGPAGTGKTESVKALGTLFGRQVLVFNCDEGIDYKSMGRIFVGLIKCGAWGCFDEFNRLDESVLSAVSQQIQVIQAALKKSESKVTLLGKAVDLDPNSGIFVTLNPAGKGYGGRQKLPDNLKQLFRSVAMTHPDNDLIAEVILFSEGFEHAKVLGKKVVSAYTLCKQLLSPQQIYDWGLRPLKAVLSLAGHLLHSEQSKKDGSRLGLDEEEQLIVRALRLSTLPKLTLADSERFDLLLKDLFPKASLKDSVEAALLDAIHAAIKQLRLVTIDSQVKKIVQLYEACRQRMGVVIVGPSGAGKTTIRNILKNALTTGLQKKIVIYELNPKSVSKAHLLGHMDSDTREFTDGILTFASRSAVKEPLDIHSWIICDGDVDPEWIEALNSVLDDNRLLTMPNGERIQFGPNVNFIFETDDLKYASPATVSRMGMIYLSEENVSPSNFFASFAASQSAALHQDMSKWMADYGYRAVKFLQDNCKQLIKVPTSTLVHSILSQMDGVSSKLQFLCGLCRSLSATIERVDRVRLEREIFNWAHEPLPDNGCASDYYLDSHGGWQAYQLREPDAIEYSSSMTVDQLPVIETPDVQRATSTLMPWLKRGDPIIFVGPEGSGKSTVLRHCFNQLKGTKVTTIHCNGQTNSSLVIQRLLQTCIMSTSQKGRTLRPRDADKLVLFIKDINLAKPDKYQTVELIQFLQQVLTYKGFYDKTLEWISLESVSLVCSMDATSAAGRTLPSTRFCSLARVYGIGHTDREQLLAIYQSILRPVISYVIPHDAMWTTPKQIAKLAASIITIYEQTQKSFTPDMYPHYSFSPRDISKLILSITRYNINPDDRNAVLSILSYECQRIYEDRLVTEEHKTKFQGILVSALKTDWAFDPAQNAGNYTFIPIREGDSITSMQKTSCEELETLMIKNVNIIQQEQRFDVPIATVPENIALYNSLQRCFSQKGGSALLAIRNGIPIRGLLYVTALSLGYTVMSLKLAKNYSYKLFCNDIKQAITKTGVEGQAVILIVETHQILDSSFLEVLNSILSGPDLSCIFTREELESVANGLKDLLSECGFRGSAAEFLSNRVKENLHLALAFDVDSDQFPLWCESNPAFTSRCDMIWRSDWTSKSLSSFATQVCTDILRNSNEKDLILQTCTQIHQSSGQNVKFFMDFVSSFSRIHRQRLQTLNQKQSYLKNGLNKLDEASSFVDKLSNDAKRRQVVLAEKQREADSALKKITESMVEASEQKREMETLTTRLRDEEVNLVKRKGKIEQELSEVEPVLRAAQSAVGEIKSESLSEIRSLRAPPPAIRDVLEGVLRLMGNLDMSWNNMKSFLGKRTVKEEIMNFDARKIPRSTRDAVEKLLSEKKDSFDEATIRRVSVAAYPLAMWVKANITFSKVLETVAPLEEDLARLTKSLESSRDRVRELQTALDTVDEKVTGLKQEFGDKTREAEVLKSELEHALAVIERSQKLLSKLSEEGGRWTKQDEKLTSISKSLVKTSLLSSAFVSYMGPQFEDSRTSNQANWVRVAGLNSYSLSEFMTTESEQLAWKAQGLPADTLSVENAVIITNTHLTPLLLDPAGNATDWLKCTLAERKPDVVYQGQEGLIRSLEFAVRFGKTLIIQDVTFIDPIFMPVLRKDIQLQSSRAFVEIGDKLVDYNDEFRLFLVSKSSSFIVPAEFKGFVNIVNFSITRAGLASQLLGITLQQEKPQLEAQKLDLLKKEEDLKIQLASLEEKLLKELASSQGNLLENVTLIESLNETKSKGLVIEASLKESRVVQESLELERKQYAPIASTGSALFFVILDLQTISRMYSFSLGSFLTLFHRVLKLKEPGEASNRINFLVDELRKRTFETISRSLFKSDRIFFAVRLIHSLYPHLFEQGEMEMLIGVTVHHGTDSATPANLPSWIPDDAKSRLKVLFGLFPSLERKLDFGSNKDKWESWIQTGNVDDALPVSNISGFQKVLLIQAIRPQLLMSATVKFCMSTLGLESLVSTSLNWKELVGSSTKETPLLFVTTPGADPSQELREFASSFLGKDKYSEISMGQGQGEAALELIRNAASSGGWVCLQNVHLVVSWLPTLEKTIRLLQPHENFRLWMITEVHDKFPQSLLQACVKITLEPPPGVKNNLFRTYGTWTSEFIGCGSALRAQCLFSLACFHAIVQERRNYLPQGWTKFYEFSSADLRSAAELITTMVRDNSVPQWQILHGLLRDAIYGARIDVKQDLLLLESYLIQHFTSDIFHIEAKGNPAMKKLCGSLSIPRTSDHSAFVTLIQSLPEVDIMPNYGLPANIDVSLQREQSERLFEQLRQMKQVGKSHAFDREKWSEVLTPMLQFWKKLHPSNELLDMAVTNEPTTDPITSFLQMEVNHGVLLIKKVHSDLINISSVIRGTKVLDPATQSIGISLVKLQLPHSWTAMWEGPSSPQEFMTYLVSKTKDILSLMTKASNGNFFKSPIRLSSFFNSRVFLNAFRQHTARNMKIALDSLKLSCKWGTTGSSNSSQTLLLENIRIQGALFDGNRLVECGRNDPLLTSMPICQLCWISDEKLSSDSNTTMELPLYGDLSRETFIVNMDVPSGGTPAKWIQAGAAFFI